MTKPLLATPPPTIMLRKIPVHQLRVGMFVQEVCGSWMTHPFWRSSFKVEDARQIRQLAVVKEVVINTDKGLDVDVDLEAQAAPGSSVEEPSDVDVGISPASSQPAASNMAPDEVQQAVSRGFEQEVQKATKIVEQSRGAMQSMFSDARLGKAVDTVHCLPLVDEITQSVARNPGAIVSLVRLKSSDDYAYMHSVAVCALMVSLARQLKLNEADTREAGLAGLVHDLGKAQMPLEVLNKPSALTPAEFAIMKGHPEAGYRMLLDGQGIGPIPLDVCLHHHEKVNGKGYPHGLQGDEISLFAKMGAVCDVYDAITSNRPYKVGWDPAHSVQRMAQWTQEGHFDELIFQAFVKSVGIYPTGSLVKLKSGHLGVVVEQGSQSLLHPIVRVFFSTKSDKQITPVLLDLGDAKVADHIESCESAATWGFKNLDQLWLPPGL